MPEKTPNSLLRQESALGTYLNDMLHRATQVVLVPESEAEPLKGKDLLATELLTQVEPVEVPVPAVAVETSSDTNQVEPVDEDASLSPDSFPLQCLMFKVGENLLSVPLIEMHSVVEWCDNMTRLPSEPDWKVGILKHRDNNVQVVDSASVLKIKRAKNRRSAHILVLGDEKWGITCDEIDKVVTLEYDDIQWNQTTANKMTLGTIRSTLSSLLNSRGIIESLQSGPIN